MRYLSLFSGIEAAGIWHELGWECVGLAEIEPFPCKVLAHHYQNVPNLGSVTEITEAQVRALGHIDVIVFGAPCQDLSIAGKRKGFTNEDGTHTRSGLFFTALQIAEWSGARFAVYENVPGMFSSSKGADFAAVVGEMAGARFDIPKNGWPNTGVAVGQRGLVEWVTLDAQFIRTPRFPRAVPQRRRRVFVVRDSGDWASRPPLFLEPESLCGNPPPSRGSRKEIAANVTDRAYTCGGIGSYLSGDETSPLMRTGADLGPGCEALMVFGVGENDAVGHCLRSGASKADKHESTTYVAAFDKQSNAEYGDADIVEAMSARDYKSPTDLVTFASRDVAQCITSTYGKQCDNSDTALGPNVAIALAGNTIGRKPENGGNHTGYDETGSSYTLTKTDVHAVAYSFDSMSSNSMKSANPISGCNEVDVAKCPNTSRGLDPACNQGGMAVAYPIDLRNSARDPEKYDASEDGTGRGTPIIASTIAFKIRGGCEGGGKGFLGNSERAFTLATTHDQDILTPTMQVRRLTPVECARLQGFPDDYLSQVKGYSDSAAYKALGNSMARNVMDYIGMRIAAIDAHDTNA